MPIAATPFLGEALLNRRYNARGRSGIVHTAAGAARAEGEFVLALRRVAEYVADFQVCRFALGAFAVGGGFERGGLVFHTEGGGGDISLVDGFLRLRSECGEDVLLLLEQRLTMRLHLSGSKAILNDYKEQLWALWTAGISH